MSRPKKEKSVPELFDEEDNGGKVSPLKRLPKGWRLIRLGDFIDSSLGKMLDQNKNRGKLQYYLGNSDVRWGYFNLTKLSMMRFEEQEIKKYGLVSGDLVVCEGGEPGRAAVWKGEMPNMKFQKALHRIRPQKGLSNHYLYYWFLSAGKKKSLERYFTGTTIKHLTGKVVQELELNLPPIIEQQKIAAILSSLDDKIALNRAMNETLEAMAQALFKSWFVDFDPVRAKARGEKPIGMDEDTAALFPDSFEESELGMIPKGWEAKTIGEDFIITMGQSPPGDSYNTAGNGEVFYQGRTDFGFRFPSNRIYTTDPKRRAKKLNTLVSVRAPVGDINMANEDCCIGRGLAAVIHRGGSHSYTYYCMKSIKPYFDEFEKEGTVFGAINKDSFIAIDYIQPPSTIIDLFSKIAKYIDTRILINSEQQEALAQIRDSLLPMLLSGEISVASKLDH